MKGDEDTGSSEGLPVCDVLSILVWVVLRVLVDVVANGGANVGVICFFEREAEMVWHLDL